ncbi:MAG: enoyl-CoA hydratase-related protein [Planctomycetota bacterium]|jgi:2-(1,2-epoxy-1,2-dihydrophenyl)acetyl-CoA isomerase
MPATATTFETLTVETSDGICTITLNRPETYNAFSDQLTFELQDALKGAERDAGANVIIITGAGKAFCSGQDVAELKEKYVPGYVPHLGTDIRRRYNPIARRLREMAKPSIAAVNGVAAGAGMSLALACDLRVASDKASFLAAFINVGLVPDTAATFTLPRLVGLANALELCLTGDKIAADEALRIGLVNRVVPADQLMAETHTLATRLAALPARGITLIKHLLNQSYDNTLGQQLEAEAFAQETAGLTEDHVEGVVAFIEKRKPQFKGR